MPRIVHLVKLPMFLALPTNPNSSDQGPFERLPDEILALIFQHLPLQSRVPVVFSSKTLAAKTLNELDVDLDNIRTQDFNPLIDDGFLPMNLYPCCDPYPTRLISSIHNWNRKCLYCGISIRGFASSDASAFAAMCHFSAHLQLPYLSRSGTQQLLVDAIRIKTSVLKDKIRRSGWTVEEHSEDEEARIQTLER